jgi:hypothetical protein
MAVTIQIHISNADPIIAEVDKMPDPQAAFLTCTNPRSRDGKPVYYVDADAIYVLFPWHRISFVEIYPGEEEKKEIETFYRE